MNPTPSTPSSCWADSCARSQSPLASHQQPSEDGRESGWRFGRGEGSAELIQNHFLLLWHPQTGCRTYLIFFCSLRGRLVKWKAVRGPASFISRNLPTNLLPDDAITTLTKYVPRSSIQPGVRQLLK